MKTSAISLLAGLGATILATPFAYAQTTRCTGPLTNPTIEGDLIVPDGARCGITGGTVSGNVLVGRQASLAIFTAVGGRPVHIGGNVQGESCLTVNLNRITAEYPTILISGNVHIDGCTKAANVERITISGNGWFEHNLTVVVSESHILGNLVCQGNTYVFGGSNQVDGRKLGQCAGL